jgi:hypothetical protein
VRPRHGGRTKKGLALQRFTVYSAAMSEIVRAITTGTTIGIMIATTGIMITKPLPAGRRVRSE